MAFNFATGEISPGPHIMTPDQSHPLVRELAHGDNGYADVGMWWVDYEHKTWINGDAPVIDAVAALKHVEQELQSSGIDPRSLDEDERLQLKGNFGLCRLARVIVPELHLDGVILDVVDTQLKTVEGEVGQIMIRTDGPEEYDPERLDIYKKEVIAWAGNLARLKSVEASFARDPFNIDLGIPIADLLNGFSNGSCQRL